MQTNLTLDWADGSYDFKLSWPGCAEVERKSNAGIQAIYERVMLAGAHTADVVEIIRQGLLSGAGGLVDGHEVITRGKPAIVNALIDRYVTGPDAPPFADSWSLAKAIISAYMVGYEGAQKKSPADGANDSPQATESTQPRSSPTAR